MSLKLFLATAFGPAGFVLLALSPWWFVPARTALDDVSSVRERTAFVFVPGNGSPAVPLIPAAGYAPTSGLCYAVTEKIWAVNEGSTDFNVDGVGPYCDGCPLGPVVPLAGRAWALANGDTTVLCRFVDGGGGFFGGQR